MTITDVENLEMRIDSLKSENMTLINTIDEKNELIEYYEHELEALKQYVNYLETKIENIMNNNNNNNNNYNNNDDDDDDNTDSHNNKSSLSESSPTKIDLWNPSCLLKKIEASSAYEKLAPAQKKAIWLRELHKAASSNDNDNNDNNNNIIEKTTKSSEQKKKSKKLSKYDDHWNKIGFK